MGFGDGRARRTSILKFGDHQLKVHPTRCCGKYLKSLEIKYRWFMRAPKGESYDQF